MFGSCTIGPSDHTKVPSVVLRSADGQHSCVVFTYGATVLSWVNDNQERLFVSKEAILDGSKAVRGGIPLVFPQFAQPNPAMAQHGFARNQIWEFAGSESNENSISVILRCKHSSATLSLWPHEFCLLYRISLFAKSLVTELTVLNPNESDKEFSFQCLQHTYLQIPHISTTNVKGLQGRMYLDKMRDQQIFPEQDEEIIFDRETDRIYLRRSDAMSSTIDVVVTSSASSASGELLLTSTSSACISMDLSPAVLQSAVCDVNLFDDLSSYLKESKSISNNSDVDIVVWNPWIAKAKALVDLSDDGYLSFVCIEPGCVSDNVTLPPLASLSLTQTLSIP